MTPNQFAMFLVIYYSACILLAAILLATLGTVVTAMDFPAPSMLDIMSLSVPSGIAGGTIGLKKEGIL